MKITITCLLLLSSIFFSCKKDNDGKYKNYGCIYGTSKATGERTYIRCGHREIYQSGNNQSSADIKATNLGIPKENVTVMNLYTDFEFIPNENCDCK